MTPDVIPSSPDPAAEWWTTAEVAAHLGVRPATVSSYRMRGQMPQPDRKLGRTQLWKPATILAWQDRRRGRGNWSSVDDGRSRVD